MSRALRLPRSENHNPPCRSNTRSFGLLTAGTGGVFSVANGALVSTTGGDITVSADDVVISANSSINAGGGIVTIRQSGTTSRPISLGGATAGTLGLSDT